MSPRSSTGFSCDKVRHAKLRFERTPPNSALRKLRLASLRDDLHQPEDQGRTTHHKPERACHSENPGRRARKQKDARQQNGAGERQQGESDIDRVFRGQHSAQPPLHYIIHEASRHVPAQKTTNPKAEEPEVCVHPAAALARGKLDWNHHCGCRQVDPFCEIERVYDIWTRNHSPSADFSFFGTDDSESVRFW